jgi:uncharacterized iron-regulated membrane protein
MKWLDLLHRWTGGLVGLILAMLGLTGAILVHRDAWVMLPHAGDARVTDVGALAEATQRLMGDPTAQPLSIIFATDGFGLDRLTLAKGAGAYSDQAGNIVARWQTQWERPEIWLFDLHHHLFAGDVGETILGIAALCGLFFVISGIILWWRTKSTFKFRLLPKRLSRPSIVWHHRDLGVVMAPLLLLSLFTGAVFVFRPVASLILGPGTEADLKAASKAPTYKAAELAPDFDWRALTRAAHARFPEAELRIVGVPRGEGGMVTVRMRQPAEWLPNGRTMLWFAADTGKLIGVRDANALSTRAQIYNRFYPLHAAKVGGLAWRIVMTLSGLTLFLLGTLTVWAFWFRRPRARPMARRVTATT